MSSSNNNTPVSAYIAEANKLRHATEHLIDFATFGAFADIGPEDVTWAHVTTLQAVNAALRDVLDMIDSGEEV